MLCEAKVINKNPKYRIIKYDSEYLMIDLASNWIVFFFPFINWLIPKTYVKITKNDYEKLNIVKPVKNKSIGWTIFAGIVLLGGTVRRNTYLFDFQLEKNMVIVICCAIFLGVLILFLFLNRKLRLEIYNNNSSKGKIILFPSLKNFCFTIFYYFLFGGLSIMALSMLLTLNPQNIIGFIGWLVMTAGFFLLNMSSIIDKKIYVLSKTNTVEK
ncbi:membrane spanning protein [Staphylococcus aureus]|nr:membrane spanning protein [Staphylococcus aureus]